MTSTAPASPSAARRPASRPASARSPSRPRWPSTPRPRRRRRPARTSSASAPASPTSRPRPPIVAAAEAACAVPANHRYTPAGGLPELKQAVVDKTQRDSGLTVTAAQVLVTNGGKQAVYEAFATLLDPGDEVLLPAPYWTTYPEAVRLAGGVPVDVVTTEDQGYRVTVEQLEAARTAAHQGAAVVLAVQPDRRRRLPRRGRGGRPLGARARHLGGRRRDLRAPGLRRRREHVSMPVAVPELADTCVVVNGVAKTYAMTGWRVGLAARPDRRRQGRHQPAVARDEQRRQRLAARGDRRADR